MVTKYSGARVAKPFLLPGDDTPVMFFGTIAEKRNGIWIIDWDDGDEDYNEANSDEVEDLVRLYDENSDQDPRRGGQRQTEVRAKDLPEPVVIAKTTGLTRISAKTDLKESIGTMCYVDTSLDLDAIVEQIVNQVAPPGFMYGNLLLLDNEGNIQGKITSGQYIERGDKLFIERAFPQVNSAPTTQPRDSAEAMVTPTIKNPKKQKKRDLEQGDNSELEIVEDIPKRKRRKRNLEPLPEEERAKLENHPLDLDDFAHFLRNEEFDSDQTCKEVLGKARKLASGEGITYIHWPEGTVFCDSEQVDLSWDFVRLRQEAVGFEETYGKDRSKGKLLLHPINKLHFYQRYYLSNRQEV